MVSCQSDGGDLQLESAIWRIDSGESLTLAFTKLSSDCSLALMSSAASCNDRWIASLSSSSSPKRPLLPRCLRGDGDGMLVLQRRLSMVAHRVCGAQPDLLWLEKVVLYQPFLCPTKLCVAAKAVLQLPSRKPEILVSNQILCGQNCKPCDFLRARATAVEANPRLGY